MPSLGTGGSGEETMRRSRLGVVIWLAPVVVGLAAAAALSADRTGAPADRPGAAPVIAAPVIIRGSEDVTGSIASASARTLPLSDEERGRIFDAVMLLADVPVAHVVPPDVAPSDRLPGSVALQDLPASVAVELPLVRGYKFVKLDDRILLVSPLDRSVVAEMPRYKVMLD
jgi:Protein of unknown function (DUF1236)